MAVQRILQQLLGKLVEYVPVTVSAGAASAGQIPALNNAGTLDNSVMPSGVAPDVIIANTSEALVSGAFVNIWSNAGAFAIRNADASVLGKEAHGFVLAAVASGASATAQLSGINTGVTGQVPGFVYLSATTPGQSSAVAPGAAGQTVQNLGMAISATSIQFDPQPSIAKN